MGSRLDEHPNSFFGVFSRAMVSKIVELWGTWSGFRHLMESEERQR